MLPLSAAGNESEVLGADLWLDGTLVFAGTAAWVTSEVFKDDLGPSSCRWCEVNSVDNSVRSRLRWDNARLADSLSNVGLLAVPLGALGGSALLAARAGGKKAVITDSLLIVEAAVVASDLNQLIKFVVGRERPYAHFSGTPTGAEENLSFYSGHASFVFAVAVAGGTIATFRRYASARWLWCTGLAIASTTAYLRIAADKHYLTDVITGAALGSVVGFAVPYLHRGWALVPMGGPGIGLVRTF